MKWIPTWCCSNIYNVDFNVLKEQNVKYIFTDLDNTLAPYNIALPERKVIDLVNSIKNQGFNLIIVSNNTGKRVELFSKGLGVDYISGAKKPFIFVIKKYLEQNNIDINECVLIGDQIMTDIKCAIRLKCKCILTNPLSNEEAFVTFFNRRIDRYYRKKYNLDSKCNKIDRRGV